ncbi:hypothetical protein BU17DRAFT_79998 [Hysterangium stoloniferum]|nr:hypothetical protein BU17DRAFT_79998 [Hysterangium stoloniferum]
MPFLLSQEASPDNASINSKYGHLRASMALDIYEQLVYGKDQTRSNVEAAFQRIYEPNAMCDILTLNYENPFLTATSRGMIADIYHITQQWSEIDIPTPYSVLSRVLPFVATTDDKWFPMLRVWSEVGDICDAESFDGRRKSMVEHTLHVLLLPGIHAGRLGGRLHHLSTSETSLDTPSACRLYSIPHFQISSEPSLAIPNTQLSWPSPFYFQLRMISRLEFNGERVAYHRDIWDVKDLVALVPGAKVAQYVGTRLAARALATIGNVGTWLWGRQTGVPDGEYNDKQWAHSSDNSLGLLGIDMERMRADAT